MATALKTQRTKASVSAFLNKVADERRRKDAKAVAALMQEITGEKPAMWGASIVGFGSYHYKYASGQEGDWLLVGFSPRKDNLTLYVMPWFGDYADLMARLGKYRKGVSCIYIKSLDDVHVPTLRKLVRQSVRHLKKAEKEMRKARG
jgi:hypothetical protein